VKSLWLDWPKLRARVRTAGEVLLLLDFDGTLSRIVRDPAKARLMPGIRYLLGRLAALPRVHVAVLSGRSVESLKAGVAMKRIYLGGNHGLELRGPGLRFAHPRAHALAPLLRAVAGDIRRHLPRVPGARLEEKGVSLSLHFRGLKAVHLRRFEGLVQRFRSRTARFPLRWRTGKKVWEVVPDVPWHKGEAALHLFRHLGRPLCVAVGDDVTDEDMFRAISPSGITVRIGYEASSAARFYLNRQRDIVRLLRAVHDQRAA
jgi:trehalose 6-phosphate phosphatase